VGEVLIQTGMCFDIEEGTKIPFMIQFHFVMWWAKAHFFDVVRDKFVMFLHANPSWDAHSFSVGRHSVYGLSRRSI
jgi:hypothetical protein